MRRRWAAIIALGLGLVSASARADDPIAAEATFAKGRALMKEGRFAEACAAFELSSSLERAAGTQANLAECYVKLGRTASAWLAYRESASIAQQAGSAARAAEARDRAAKLEPGLCKLVVRAQADAASAISIRRDGKIVDPQLWGVPVPIDPGSHEVSATYGGEERVTKAVIVAAPSGPQCADTIVEMPARKGAPMAIPEVSPVIALPGPRVDANPVNSPQGGHGGTARRVLGGSLAGLGIVALGVGGGFAIDAIGKKSDAGCVPAGCTPTGATELRAAGRAADVSTVTVTTGLVLVAAGAIVWFTAPAAARSSAAASDLGQAVHW